MKRLLTITMLLLIFVSAIYSQDRQRNNIIVFDITGSMLGKPAGSGNTDIWQPSIDLLKMQLNSFPEGEKVTLYVFGVDLIKVDEITTSGNDQTINELVKRVDSYRNQTQSYTCIYKSLKTIIENLNKNYINTIYLFTDGKNSDNHDPCEHISPYDLADEWVKSTQKNEFLYIFKLKNFNLPSELASAERTEVTSDALYNLKIDIEPVNTNIRVGRKNMSSSQKFRITGAGVKFLPSNMQIFSKDITLTSASGIEHATTDPQSFAVNNNVQNFKIRTLNQIDNIENDIYKGNLKYVFKNNTVKQRIKNGNITLNISIKDIPVQVIFNNMAEEPKVTIDFID